MTAVPAGKELVAGGQVGYSRQVYKDDHNRLVAELGYDMSLEQAAAPDHSRPELSQESPGLAFFPQSSTHTDARGG